MGGCLSSSSVPQPTQYPNTPATRLSPIYQSLPEGAEQNSVRNVYDGDTLTLTNGRRVRFLGIDTPELREQQAFAIEAKNYTYDKCQLKTVWLTFARGDERTDRYNRILAFVWVKVNGGFLNVNEGIIAAGLGYTYSYGRSKDRFDNWNKLVTLQKQARQRHLGMWKNFSDYQVYKTYNGGAFHRRDCTHLSRSKTENLQLVYASEAMDKGLHPCRTCLPDEAAATK